MVQTEITNFLDVIDSRQIIERIEELTDSEMDSAEMAELDSLRKLETEASDYSEDWEFGSTLIRDSYFVTYAQELAEDIGAVDDSATWPNTCIDWDRAARELRMDYTSVSFDGIDYWVR